MISVEKRSDTIRREFVQDRSSRFIVSEMYLNIWINPPRVNFGRIRKLPRTPQRVIFPDII